MSENKENVPPDAHNGNILSTESLAEPLTFEAILSFPMFWPSSTTFVFLRDAYNCIKDDNDTTTKNFKMDVDNDPQGKQVIFEDWITRIDSNHWTILQREGPSAKTKNTKKERHISGHSGQSVIKLLRLIRNKAEHFNDLNEDEQKTLGWYTDGKFDQHKFVSYWANIFPHLLPFAWQKFHQFKDDSMLKGYYSSHKSIHNLSMIISFESLVMELMRTLNAHKENGGLLKRYKCDINWTSQSQGAVPNSSNIGKPCTIEFRTLAAELLIPRMVSCTSTLMVEINNTHLGSTWISHTSEDGSDVRESTIRMSFNNTQTDIQSLAIFIGINFNVKLVQEVCSTDNFLPKNVIFYLTSTKMSNLEMLTTAQALGAVDTLSEWKFNFCEMSPQKQIEVLGRKVVFQNKEIEFKSLLPKSYFQAGSPFDSSLLQWLEGEFLQELITNKNPTLFNDTLVKNSDFYIVRRIICRGSNILSRTLRHKSQDIILVTNIQYEQLKTLSKTDEVALELSSNQEQLKERVVLAANEIDFHDVCDKISKDRNFHILKYTSEDSFQWLRSRGSMKLLQIQKFLDKTDSSILEDEFIAHIVQQKERLPVIIADKPGMGKSCLLKSLAEKLSKFENNFIIFIAMNDFMKALGTSITKTTIIDTILKFVTITAAEKELVKLWSETESADIQVRCELMFDGMDEVTKHKQEAKKVLKVLHKVCPSFRLWITVRDHMLEELEESLGVLGYKIVPFEESDQILFLRNYWQKKLAVEHESSEDIALCKFAEKCTKGLLHGSTNKSFSNEIAGIPLQCRMVAEVYKSNAKQFLSQATNADFTTSLSNLYQKVIDKKLEEYLRKSIPNLDLSLGIVDYVSLGTRKVHWYLAIKLLFSDSWADAFNTILINGVKKETIDRISEVGLIQKLEPLAFVHRTFAEYYIASFVFEIFAKTIKLELSSQETWASFIVATVLNVVSEQYEHDPVTKSSIVIATFKFPVICYFFNAMLENCSDPALDTKLVKLVCKNCHDFQNEIPFQCQNSALLATVRNDYLHIFQFLFETLETYERDKFLAKTKDYHDFFLNVSVKCSSVEFFKYICTLLEDWYKRVENLEYKISSELLCTAIRKGRYEMVKLLVLEKGFGHDTWADLQNRDKDKFGLIQHCLRRSRKDKRSVIEEKKRIIEFLVGLDKSVLEVRDGKGRTPLLLQIDASIMLKKWLVSQGADVHAVGSSYGNTGLHWYYFDQFGAAIYPDIYHEMLELFTGQNDFKINTISSGNTPLHCAVKTYYDELRHDSLDLFQKHGADFNIRDEDGKSVLHLAIEKNCQLNFIEKLIASGSNPKIRNNEGQDALDLATTCDNSRLRELLVSKCY